MMVDVSVIIPAYNAEKHLGRCLDSAVNQTYNSYEVILVDDGSTDGTADICDKYAQAYSCVKTIHQTNSGVSVARNTGISQARGTYIMFCDSDDVLEANYIECMMGTGDTCDLVVVGVKNYDADGEIHHLLQYQRRIINGIEKNDILKMLDLKAINSVWAKRFTKDIIERNHICFECERNLGEDVLFVSEYLTHCNNVVFVSDTPYHYYKYDVPTLSTFDASYVYKLYHCCVLSVSKLENRWGGLRNTAEWRRYIWPVYHSAIFNEVLKSEDSFLNKLKILGGIFETPGFLECKNDLDKLMGDDSILWRRIVKTGNAAVVLALWQVIKVKKRIQG